MSGKLNSIGRKEFHEGIHSVRRLMDCGKISEEKAQILLSWIMGNYVENKINSMIEREFNDFFSVRK